MTDHGPIQNAAPQQARIAGEADPGPISPLFITLAVCVIAVLALAGCESGSTPKANTPPTSSGPYLKDNVCLKRGRDGRLIRLPRTQCRTHVSTPNRLETPPYDPPNERWLRDPDR